MKDRKFNKAFLPCAIFSILVIIFGAAGIFVRGINFGIDFVPGLIEEVKITSDKNYTVEDLRTALKDKNVVVKELGSDDGLTYQVRAAINDSVSNEELQADIEKTMSEALPEARVEVVKTDFVGSGLSENLAWKSIVLALVTVLLIWGYAAIRFHWDFALGAIVALIHDCLIMFTFISWTQVEFSTTTLAAVLTIFGYSINATVVILDRVRENIRLVQTRDFKDILDRSIGGTMTRSIITTVTTLFASISLIVFTSGSIRDFAIVLTVGLVSGCYSSLFISNGVISVFRRNWEPGVWALHVRPHGDTSASN